jgi:hypothetical protein
LVWPTPWCGGGGQFACHSSHKFITQNDVEQRAKTTQKVVPGKSLLGPNTSHWGVAATAVWQSMALTLNQTSFHLRHRSLPSAGTTAAPHPPLAPRPHRLLRALSPRTSLLAEPRSPAALGAAGLAAATAPSARAAAGLPAPVKGREGHGP